MGYKIDLKGMVFGKWTVLEFDNENSKPQNPKWIVQCSCEKHTIKSVQGGTLKGGESKSCGCLTNEDLTGKKFGRLTVIKKADIKADKGRSILWECKCDCGNENLVFVRTSSLKKGNTQSCGCLHKERTSISNKKYNAFDLNGEYGILYTFKKEEFYFDKEDYDKIKNICWNNSDGYAHGYIQHKKKYCLMHRYIMNVLDNNTVVVDHKNLQRNDNRKENLRICTTQQNNMNIGVASNNNSGFTGVMWSKEYNCWKGGISINYKDYYRSFENFEDAVAFRLALEEKCFGEFAYKNKNIKEEFFKEIDIEQILLSLPIRRDNTSGIRGVSWSKEKNKWRAYINKDGKRIERAFLDFKKAVEWRKEMESQNFEKIKTPEFLKIN